MIDSFLELILFSFASFRLTRLIVIDSITAFIRRPFHEEMEELDEDGRPIFYIEIKGSGLRAWIGELLSCYWCTGIWVTTFLYILSWKYPGLMGHVITILAIAGLAAIIEFFINKETD